MVYDSDESQALENASGPFDARRERLFENVSRLSLQ